MLAAIARKQQADWSRAAPRRVDVRKDRHAEEDEQPEGADAELDQRVDAQRMLARGDVARQQEAAETHAAHEGAEQDAKRDRRRANDELQQLKPDDLVNEGGAAAGDKEQQQRGHIASRGHRITFVVVVSGPGRRRRIRLWRDSIYALLWPSGEKVMLSRFVQAV